MSDKKEYFNTVLKLLKENYPEAKIKLKFKNPFQLLIATILSAQCTDDRVNIVTESLFKKYKTPKDFADADIDELMEDIKSTGFYRNKANNIKKASEIIVEKYGGQVPRSMRELTSLPGVARKTANIVLSDGYGIVEGIAVDTHVLRLAKRLGFSSEDNRDKVEEDLMRIVPKSDWHIFSHLLQAHGRSVCKAKKPRCDKCFLNNICPSAFKT
ncbi:MAG: endonuclease III [Candidatus Odinarchaeia archaeon]